MSDDTSEAYAASQRELIATQEMLAFVLFEVNRPVVVKKESLSNGLPNGTQIRIDENLEAEEFIFSLDIPNE